VSRSSKTKINPLTGDRYRWMNKAFSGWEDSSWFCFFLVLCSWGQVICHFRDIFFSSENAMVGWCWDFILLFYSITSFPYNFISCAFIKKLAHKSWLLEVVNTQNCDSSSILWQSKQSIDLPPDISLCRSVFTCFTHFCPRNKPLFLSRITVESL
jgi:hypothetical protein